MTALVKECPDGGHVLGFQLHSTGSRVSCHSHRIHERCLGGICNSPVTLVGALCRLLIGFSISRIAAGWSLTTPLPHLRVCRELES